MCAEVHHVRLGDSGECVLMCMLGNMCVYMCTVWKSNHTNKLISLPQQRGLINWTAHLFHHLLPPSLFFPLLHLFLSHFIFFSCPLFYAINISLHCPTFNCTCALSVVFQFCNVCPPLFAYTHTHTHNCVFKHIGSSVEVLKRTALFSLSLSGLFKPPCHRAILHLHFD